MFFISKKVFKKLVDEKIKERDYKDADGNLLPITECVEKKLQESPQYAINSIYESMLFELYAKTFCNNKSFIKILHDKKSILVWIYNNKYKIFYINDELSDKASINSITKVNDSLFLISICDRDVKYSITCNYNLNTCKVYSLQGNIFKNINDVVLNKISDTEISDNEYCDLPKHGNFLNFSYNNEDLQNTNCKESNLTTFIGKE